MSHATSRRIKRVAATKGGTPRVKKKVDNDSYFTKKHTLARVGKSK